MRRWLRYQLERALLRGPTWRLAFIALVLVLVSVCGGLAVLPFAGADFAGPGDAVWWAFLRLTDPGYLGDDEGLAKRVISTALTVSGYVLFMGALIAIMSQWLNSTLSRLERGDTPIAMEGHLLVVGWTDRSAAIVREFLLSEHRVRRFLERRGASGRLQVVLLVDELDPAIQSEIATRFGDLWDDSIVTLRAGSRLRLEHLERVAFTRAAAVVLPGSDDVQDFAGSDIAVVKTLLSIASYPGIGEGETPPRVVAEIFDQRKVPLADVAYSGDLDVVPSDLHISRLMVQNIRNPGLSYVYAELLTHRRGATVYLRPQPQLDGVPFEEAAARYGRAVLLGVVRRQEGRLRAILNPPPGFVAERDDRFVVIADTFDDADPGPAGRPLVLDDVSVLEEPARERRVLLLGWSDKIPAMVQEFGTHHNETVHLDVMSVVPSAERHAALAGWGEAPQRVVVGHLDGDFTLPGDLQRADPASYDNVVLLGSDWVRSDEEADARTVVGYLTLREVIAGARRNPDVLVELTDPKNAMMFDQRRGEVVVSPLLISNLLAHVTLRAEILPVFDTLFSAGGPSFLFRDPGAYGLSGTQAFEDVRRATRKRGHVAIGVRARTPRGYAEPTLMPPRGARFDLDSHELVVMAPTG